MIHTQQESAYLTGDTAPMLELYALVGRYRPLLQKEGTYRRIKQQLAAYALGVAFKYRRMGLKDASHAHYEIAWSSDVRRMEALAAILRLLGLRLVLKTTGIRLMPVRPSWLLGKDYDD